MAIEMVIGGGNELLGWSDPGSPAMVEAPDADEAALARVVVTDDMIDVALKLDASLTGDDHEYFDRAYRLMRVLEPVDAKPDEGFEPTSNDIEDLAVAFIAAAREVTYREAAWFVHREEGEYWRRLARAAFDHAGYLPSIAAARRDAHAKARAYREVWRMIEGLRADNAALVEALGQAERFASLLVAENQVLRDELGLRAKRAEVVAEETRDQALVMAVRGR